MSKPIIRTLDIIFSMAGLLFLSPLMLVIFIIGLFDTGSPIFRQERLGRNQALFILFKFRSMSPGVNSVATHLVSLTSITPFGKVLRKSKLDELPQLLNVLKGEMSLSALAQDSKSTRTDCSSRKLGVYSVHQE